MTDFNDERDPEVVAGLADQARERQREDHYTESELALENGLEADDWLVPGPTVGYCSKCGEARESFYTCRDGGSTVAKEDTHDG